MKRIFGALVPNRIQSRNGGQGQGTGCCCTNEECATEEKKKERKKDRKKKKKEKKRGGHRTSHNYLDMII